MIRSFHRIAAASALVLLLSAPSAAHAMVMPMTLQQLTDASTAVVLVNVGAERARTLGTGDGPAPMQTIVTDSALSVVRAYKGSKPARFTLRQRGGEAAGYKLLVSDIPDLKRGEHVVLFLDQNGIVGGEQGCLRVVEGQVPQLGISLAELERSIGTALGDGLSAQDDPALRAAERAAVAVGASATTAEVTSRAAVAVAIASITPPGANSGTGEQVTISGTGFGSSAGNVYFARGDSTDWSPLLGRVVSWSDTTVVVEVPANAQSGSVYLERSDGASTSKDYTMGFSFLGQRWPTHAVSYRINENTSDTSGEGAAIQQAMATWNVSGADFSIGYSGVSSKSSLAFDSSGDPVGNGVNDVFFSYGLPAGYLAVNMLWMDAAETQFLESDLIMSDSVKWGNGASGSYWDVETVALHEFGHTLGLGDQYMSTDRTMGAAIQGETRRVLGDNEIRGAVYAYGQSSNARLNLGASANLAPSYGKPAYVSVRLYDRFGQPMVGQTVTLYRSSAPVAVLKGSVSDPGLYYGSAPVVRSKTVFTAAWPGDAVSGAGYLTVTVKPKAKLTVNAPESNRHKRTFKVKGGIAPAHTSAKIVFEVWKKYSYKSGYFRYNDYTVYSSKGSFTKSLKLSRGTYRVRIKHSDAGHAASASGYDYFKVR